MTFFTSEMTDSPQGPNIRMQLRQKCACGNHYSFYAKI